MKILVTGAAGFIGSHLCERLAKMEYEVVGIDNFNDYYDPFLKRNNARNLSNFGVKIIEKDITKHNLDSYLDSNFNYIFHCAAQPGIAASSSFESYLSNNFIATKKLIDFAAKLDSLKMFINIATSSIYGKNVTCNEEEVPKPISNYGVTKLAGEQLVLSASREAVFKACSLRLYSVYGSRERPDKLFTKLINCTIKNEEFPLFKGSLEHKRSFTHVSDIVNGITSCIHKETVCNGEIINLGIDKEYTTKQGIETVEKLLNKKIKIKNLPARNGDQNRTLAIIEKAKDLLNYNPKITLEEGVKEQIEWVQSLLKK